MSGGGGVGKSHAITVAYQAALHTLKIGSKSPTEIVAILTAPTATAAFNIDGMTIYSALHLPIKLGNDFDSYKKLSNNIKNTLKCKLQHLRILIIDEISMVGVKTLLIFIKGCKKSKMTLLHLLEVFQFLQLEIYCSYHL